MIRDALDRAKAADARHSIFRELLEEPPSAEPAFVFSASDNLVTADLGTCGGSRILEGHRPVFDATAVARMREAGGSLIGKTNLDEFGFGHFSVDSGYSVPLNPFDAERSCGGPCGGAACAAASLDGHVALAAGGSLSGPASFCGVYGLTPTYGRVSRHGVLDCGSSSDRVGLLALDPGRLSECLPVIAGRDPRDPTSCVQPAPETEGRIGSIAVPEDATAGVDAEVRTAFEAALEMLASMGFEIATVATPSLAYAPAAHRVLVVAEASTNVAKYVGMRYGRQDGDLSMGFDDYFTHFRSEYFGDEAKLMTILGTYCRMEGNRDRYYAKALKVRAQTIGMYKELFETYDAVLTPSMPSVPPRFDAIAGMTAAEKHGYGRLTAGPSLAGLPHLSVPCGYGGTGLPVGMQFAAAHWNEGMLLRMAADWDSAFEVRRAEAVR